MSALKQSYRSRVSTKAARDALSEKSKTVTFNPNSTFDPNPALAPTTTFSPTQTGGYSQGVQPVPTVKSATTTFSPTQTGGYSQGAKPVPTVKSATTGSVAKPVTIPTNIAPDTQNNIINKFADRRNTAKLLGQADLAELYPGMRLDRGVVQSELDAATKASYAAQRAEYDRLFGKTSNQFSQLGETLQDTLYRNAAQAVATGGSTGALYAQNQLAQLGMQQQGSELLTELAQQGQALADAEAAQYLQNVADAGATVDQNLANLFAGDVEQFGYGTALDAANIAGASQVDVANIQAAANKYAADSGQTPTDWIGQYTGLVNEYLSSPDAINKTPLYSFLTNSMQLSKKDAQDTINKMLEESGKGAPSEETMGFWAKFIHSLTNQPDTVM